MAQNLPRRGLRKRIRDWRYYERERWHLANFPSRRVRQYIRAWRGRSRTAHDGTAPRTVEPQS